jgi:hypothetical protein
MLSIFKVSGNKYCRQKASGSINFKLFTIFPTKYARISLQTVSKVTTIFTYLQHLVPENWLSAQASGYVYVHCAH